MFGFANDINASSLALGTCRTLADRRRIHHQPRCQDRGQRRRGRIGRSPPRPRRMRPLRALWRNRRERDAGIAAMREAVARGSTATRSNRRCRPGAARNALDCALWDLAAKQTGRPAYKLAGLGNPKPLVTAYTISLGTPSAMAAAAAKPRRPAPAQDQARWRWRSRADRSSATRRAAPRTDRRRQRRLDAGRSRCEPRRLRRGRRHADRAAAAGGNDDGARALDAASAGLRRRKRAWPRARSPRSSANTMRSISSSTRPAA